MLDEQKKLIVENRRLAYYIVHRYYSNVETDILLDKEELYGAAIEGLIRAASKFDVHKELRFATFATTVMHNEIRKQIKYLGAKKRSGDVVSYNTVLTNKDGDEQELLDIIPSSGDFAETYALTMVRQKAIQRFLASLNQRERMILQGLLEKKTQQAIAKSIGIAQSYASRLIIKMQNKLRMYLEREGAYD